MRSSKWLSCLIAAVLSFGIAVAGAQCLVTAFDLVPVNMPVVVSACALCSAFCSICFSTKKLWWLPALPAALLIGYLIRMGTLLQETEAFLAKITKYYDMAYGIGVVRWSGEELGHIPVTGGLAALCTVIAAVVALVLCRRGSAFWAIAFGFLPMAACFVVTDTVPETGWVFLLLSCFGLIVLTQGVRKQDGQAAQRLTAMLLVPVVLASALLFWLNPKDGYEAQRNATRQTLLSWFRDLPFVSTTPEGELTISVDGVPGTQVDLSAVGPKIPLEYAVMDVTSHKGGILYLRGQSFDIYDGLSWSASEASGTTDPYFPSEFMRKNGRITISTRSFHGRVYVPYYISDQYALTDGYIANEAGQKEYSFDIMVPDAQQPNHVAKKAVPGDRIVWQCLSLPQETRERAVQILSDAGITTSVDSGVYFSLGSWAEAIGELVSGSARYDLNTPQMPRGEADFALWFLEDSDTGYCVHFASAATVLLRAAGIPARYVTGYMFEAEAEQRTTVRSNAAHAWVEYFDPYNGWTVLDPTPADWTEHQGATEPMPTTPAATQPPTEPATRPQPTEGIDDDTKPSATEPDTDKDTPVSGEKPQNGTLWVVLGWLLAAGGTAAVIAGQYWVRKALRRKKMRTGHPNQKALARWRYAMEVSRVTKVPLTEELEDLAQKAKFSQHTLTAKELGTFDIWLAQAQLALSGKPWIVRFVIKLIWAVE